jgi:tetratricopeptide (TPR) repeat protein
MSFVRFSKTQLQLARFVGRKDFDGAIRVLEASLSQGADDVPALLMIALCHRWAHRDEDAILAARRVLASDPNSFEAIQLLSETHAQRGEHDVAVQFVRVGLESDPAPVPVPPTFFLWFVRIAAYLFPRLRHIENAAKAHLSDAKSGRAEWFAWARQYVAWYDQVAGNQRKPTIH